MTEARDPLAAALAGLDEVEQQFLEWDMGQMAAEMHGYLDTVRAVLRDTPATTPTADGLDARSMTALLHEANVDYSIHAPEGTDRWEYIGDYLADRLARDRSAD